MNNLLAVAVPPQAPPKDKPEPRFLEPKFRDPSELTEEQLTDPDWRLKQLDPAAACSKCHHCRR